LLVTSGDLGDVSWSENWRNCIHDQETVTGILLITTTVEMIEKFFFMPDGKYWADCGLSRGSGPFLERRNFRMFLNYHWRDLINTKLHCLHPLCNIAHRMSGPRSLYCLKYWRCNIFATSHIYWRCRSLHRPSPAFNQYSLPPRVGAMPVQTDG
jgi:hypothetical protein